MRSRVGILLWVMVVCMCACAAASSVFWNETTYVYPLVDAPVGSHTLQLWGVPVDPSTLAPQEAVPLAGGVLGLFAMDAFEVLQPLPDPTNPAKPWQITTTIVPVALHLPSDLDVYLVQLSAPNGFSPLVEAVALSPDRAQISLLNPQNGVTGIAVTMDLLTPRGSIPLQGVFVTLDGQSKGSNAEGQVGFPNLSPGPYTLVLGAAPDGTSWVNSEMQVTVADGSITETRLTASQNGTLRVRPMGLVAGSDGTLRLAPLATAYTVWDGDTAMGTLRSGDALSLPTQPDGHVYTLTDDTQRYVTLLLPGETVWVEPIRPITHITGQVTVDDLLGFPVRIWAGDVDIPIALDGTFLIEGDALGKPIRYQVADDITATIQGTQVHLAKKIDPSTVTGNLLANGQPLAFARVILQPLGTVAATDEQGNFLFDLLRPGDYRLELDDPNGRMATGETVLAITEPGQTLAVHLTATQPAAIAGRIFMDDNGDGYLAIGEGAVEGATLTLLSEDFTEISSLPLQDGFFSRTGLAPGTYRLRVTLPDGLIFTRTPDRATRMIAAVDASMATSEPFTLAPGETLSGVSVGATTSGQLSGFVFVDQNGNGRQDIGEPPLDDVLVTLLRGNEIVQEQTTSADGTWTMGTLRMGDYAVRLTLPDGMMVTKQRLGEAGVVNQFPEVNGSVATRPAQLRAWKPAGTLTAGAIPARVFAVHVLLLDVGLPDVAVQLYTTGGVVERLVDTQTTDAVGHATFDSVRPADYRVRVIMPEDAMRFLAGTERVLGDTGFGPPFTLALQEAWGDAVFVLTRLCALQGTVIALDGPPAWTCLVEALDETGTVIASQRTRSSGDFRLGGLLPGVVQLRVTLPAGYAFTEDFDALSVPFTLEMGETVATHLSAYRFATLSGTLTDRTAQMPLAGVVVALHLDGQTVHEMVTTADGAYRFTPLVSGSYEITVTLPDGLGFATGGDAQESTASLALAAGENRTYNVDAVAFSTLSGRVLDGATGDGLGNVAITFTPSGIALVTDGQGFYSIERLRAGEYTLTSTPPDGWALPLTDVPTNVVTLAAGENRTLPDRTLVPEARLSGRVTLGGSAPLPDVSVTLATAQGMMATAMTDTDGWFGFTQLPPSQYTLTFETTDALCTANHESSYYTIVAVAMGAVIDNLDVDTYLPGTLSGRVYESKQGEPGVPDALVTLLSAEYGEQTQTTDADGFYRFALLPPGTWQVQVTAPVDLLFEDMVLMGQPPAIVLGMGEAAEATPVALLAPARIGDLVWHDLNANGLMDSGEPGLPAVVVLLLRVENGVDIPSGTTTTNQDGFYRFDGVRPGTYRIAISPPEGYVPTKEHTGLPMLSSKLLPHAAYPLTTDALPVTSGQHALFFDAGVITMAQADTLGWVINFDGIIWK